MSYTIIQADIQKNKPGIIALWKRNFPDVPHLEKRFSWLYENNPCGPPKCWLAMCNKTSGFVGCASIIPRRMYVNGQPVLAGIAADFAVDREHRAFGPALKLQKAVTFHCAENEIDFIYGFPNKQSEAVHLRAGYRILSGISRLTKLLKTRSKTEKYVNPKVAKLLSPMADFALSSLSLIQKYAGLSGYYCEELNSFDERFDKLWKRTLDRVPVIVERNSVYLDWRYKKSPHKKYEIFTLTNTKQERLFGYIVYYRKNKRVVISDILYENPKIALGLMSEFTITMRQRDLDEITITTLEGSQFTSWLKKSIFFHGKEEGNFITFLREDLPGDSPLLNPRNWLIFRGDGDT